MRTSLTVLLACSLTLAHGFDTERAASSTRVVILGTGNPNADPERSGPAVAIIAGDEALRPDLKFPLFVKPAREGTGMGVSAQSVAVSATAQNTSAFATS